MSGFSLPRPTIPARLLLTQGEPRTGEIFVSERVPHHDGPETALEMLNRPEGFFPFRIADGGVVLVAKAQTVMLAVDHDVSIRDPHRRSVAKTVPLAVILADGSKLEGRATVELPQQSARLLDYLNAAGEPFFVVATAAATNFVNRSHVLYARPLD